MLKQSSLDQYAVKTRVSDAQHLPKNISETGRAKQFENCHESGGKLFCSLCNVVRKQEFSNWNVEGSWSVFKTKTTELTMLYVPPKQNQGTRRKPTRI